MCNYWVYSLWVSVVTFWEILSSSPPEELYQSLPYVKATKRLYLPTSKQLFIIIFLNSIWGTESCNWFDHCFFDPYLSWTNFHMLISHFAFFILILGIVCSCLLFIFVMLTFWEFIQFPKAVYQKKITPRGTIGDVRTNITDRKFQESWLHPAMTSFFQPWGLWRPNLEWAQPRPNPRKMEARP